MKELLFTDPNAVVCTLQYAMPLRLLFLATFARRFTFFALGRSAITRYPRHISPRF